jgi:ATP-dependent DNA ligase
MFSMSTIPEEMGHRSIRLACQLDLEGIVAKRADSKYEDNPNSRNWINIKNRPTVRRKEGEELFKRAG